MTDDSSRRIADDEHEIASLLIRWGHARDSADWETLAGCFHDDATIHISWMSGSAKDFLAGSQGMAGKRKPGGYTKHVFTGPWIIVDGDCAFSRCHANLFVRAEIDGHWLDFTSWFRFFDLLEKRAGAWGIIKRAGVYEKDRLDPVVPGAVPASYFADMDLSGLLPEARYLLWRQRQQGTPAADDMAVAMSDGETALKAEGEAWLKGG